MLKFHRVKRRVRRDGPAWVTALVIFSLLAPSPCALAEDGKPFPSFDVIFPTIGLHPESDNREGIVHGETKQLRYSEFDAFVDRVAPAIAVPPPGEPIELAFHLSPLWSAEAEGRLQRAFERRFRRLFPNNPLEIKFYHPRVPRRELSKMAQPGVDDVLLELKALEEAAPTEADREPIRKVRHEIEESQPVKVETDVEGPVPARLERLEQTRLRMKVFGFFKALVTGGILWWAAGKPGLESTGKAILAWSVILSRFSIDFLASVFQQPFGNWLAKHELAPTKLRAKGFWKRLSDWYVGRNSPRAARRAEMIKQATYNYLLFVLALAPLTQFALSQTAPNDPSKTMDWSYFGWQAAISLVATVVYVWGASGLRKMKQLGTKTTQDIDRKYSWVSLLNGVSDAAAAVPMLGNVRYVTMGLMAWIQANDARQAAKAQPNVRRWVFIDSWLTDAVRTKAIDPIENIDQTRLLGRKKPGENPRFPSGEAEDFVEWVLRKLDLYEGATPLRCDEALVQEAAAR